MGCCASAPSSSSPYAAQSSSSRAINTEQSQPQFNGPPTIPRPSTGASSLPRPSRSSRPLSEHVTRPLKLHVWKTKSRKKSWTRSELDRERNDFFDTRVTGRSEIWQALRTVCELLWGASLPGASQQDVNDALESGYAMLQAAEVTLPTGDLADGAYDSLGAFYQMPEWVVSDPSNLVLHERDMDKSALEGEHSGNVDDDDEDDDDKAIKRREEKGKTVIPEEDLMRVVAKLSEGPEKVVVMVGKNDSVRIIGRRVLEEAGLFETKSVKMMYMGKMLKDSESLASQNWNEEHALNAYIFEAS